MYLKFNGKSTDSIIKYLNKTATFKPGSSWLIKSISPQIISASVPIAQFISTYSYIPFDKDVFLVIAVATESFSRFNFTLQAEISNIYQNFDYYHKRMMTLPAVTYHDGEKVIDIKMLFRRE